MIAWKLCTFSFWLKFPLIHIPLARQDERKIEKTEFSIAGYANEISAEMRT